MAIHEGKSSGRPGESEAAAAGGAIRPWHIAASILIAVGLVLALFWVDSRRDLPPFAIDESIPLADYEDRFKRTAFEYSIWTLQEGPKHFQWNLRSAKYIFWVSMLISVSGVCFAFWQFAQANQFDRAGAERDEVEVRTELASLSFKTRSMATLVLLVSIAYLLVYVSFLHGVEVTEGPLAHRPRVDEPAANPPAEVTVETVESDSEPLVIEVPEDLPADAPPAGD